MVLKEWESRKKLRNLRNDSDSENEFMADENRCEYKSPSKSSKRSASLDAKINKPSSSQNIF